MINRQKKRLAILKALQLSQELKNHEVVIFIFKEQETTLMYVINVQIHHSTFNIFS